MNMKFVTFFFSAALTTLPALAHNQSPATIRRAMERAFSAFEAPTPSNVLKGQRSLRISGTNAQIFDVKKDSNTVGEVAQLEYQEEVFVVAIEKKSGEVKGVFRGATKLDEAEWKELPFIGPLQEKTK
ncbi:MAG: hypothetical protein JST16_14630 [Bdellovibrionales bacterium]|nr:hypothetical protein [Bdellovibrionales bacterium]